MKTGAAQKSMAAGKFAGRMIGADSGPVGNVERKVKQAGNMTKARGIAAAIMKRAGR